MAATTESISLPQPASHEEKLKELDHMPLFMQNLADVDPTENVAVSALQSLIYEGTPDEVAQNFKEQGNDYFKGKRTREALGFYTQGIDAKPTDPHLQEALLCNRAACNLELQNYGSVLRDCSKALSLNSTSSKAFYRSATALLALDRVGEALDACDRCLAFDPDNAAVRNVRERILKLKTTRDKEERERMERLRREREEKLHMRVAFAERNLIVVPNPDGPAENPYKPHFDPDLAVRTLIIPTFFLYPEHATSDLISHFHEDAQFSDHLATIFPPEAPAPHWDHQGQYVAGNVVIYATTHQRRLLKVGKKMTLREVCSASKGKDGAKDGLELKDGCLTFVVLPKGEVEHKWVDEYKSTRERQTDS